MSDELQFHNGTVGYTLAVSAFDVDSVLDYLDEIGVDRKRYYYSTLPVSTGAPFYNKHGVIVYSGSTEIDMLIVLKYGHLIVKKCVVGDFNQYHKYHISGLNRNFGD